MKFRFREKLKYMVLGSLLTLTGFLFGNMNGDTEAQLGDKTIDKLTVRELIVVEDITIRSNSGDPLVLISADRDGGRVTTYGPSGIGAASLAVTEDGGRLTIQGITGNAGASIGTDEDGGNIAIFNRGGKARVALSIIDGDGVAYLVNRFGESRALKP